jgi:hypothetical protein
MPLNLINMPRIIPGTYGKTRIAYDRMKKCYFLYYDGERWMGVYPDFSDCIDNLESQYDIAHGKVLITGLGFGILLKNLEAKSEVTSITVIEKYQGIVDAFLAYNTVSDKVNIIIDDAVTYSTEEEYDCLLPDHYETQGSDWKINDMNQIAKRIPHKNYWPWSIEALFFKCMYPSNKNSSSPDDFILNNSHEFYDKWIEFVEKYFNGNKLLLNITKEKITYYLSRRDWVIIGTWMPD